MRIFSPDVFEPDAVESHVHHVGHLGFQAFVGVPQVHFVGPSSALEEHFVSVQDELPVAFWVNFAFDLPDSEGNLPAVRLLPFQEETGFQGVEERFSQFPGPPKPRVFKAKGECIVRRDLDGTGLTGGECNGEGESSACPVSAEMA